MAKSNPPICSATPALVIATASHFPTSSSNLEQGRQRSASNVPLSSPAVISMEGCALDAVQIVTIGMNNDKAKSLVLLLWLHQRFHKHRPT